MEMTDTTQEKSRPQDPGRLEVLRKIAENEAAGRFFDDVEPDPPSRPLLPDEVDYLAERPSTRRRQRLACAIERVGQIVLTRYYRMETEGAEQLSELTGGAVFTSNHFGKFESLAVKNAASRAPGRHRFYKVVREGNMFIPGFLGFLLKNCRTLPLSENLHTMMKLDGAVATLLNRGDFVLIYPEQAMWWNYRKPRPLRPGAFRFAAKNGMPVVPCFVTMCDQLRVGRDGFAVQQYTCHVGAPIWPSPSLSLRENSERMRERNAAFCRETYERVYGLPLRYGRDG